ncbi:MAG: DUF4136 domain-containing protein [Steroidobacteraceae bacterium]
MIRPVGNSASVSPLNQRRMQDAIEAEFAAKGYTLKQDPASADFIVSFTVGARDKIDVADYPAPYRWDNHWSWSSFERTFSVHQYREGQLAIDIFDGQSHRPVWHGAVSKRITESMRKDPKPQIDAAVKAILTRFPPGARAKP